MPRSLAVVGKFDTLGRLSREVKNVAGLPVLESSFAEKVLHLHNESA